MLNFTIGAELPNGRGRAGTIKTAHGDIETPAFIPVGTKATVKSLTPEHVRDLGAEAVLANTYHLYLQPGTEILEKAGGLRKFMNWSGPTFTDSGGFQAFSLGAAFNKTASKIGARWAGGRDISYEVGEKTAEKAQEKNSRKSAGFRTQDEKSQGSYLIPHSSTSYSNFAKVTEDGVEFKSVLDGSTHFFTPEKSIDIQHSIGADIIFAFDECTSPQSSYEYQVEAMNRTHRWAVRSLERHQNISKIKNKKSNTQEDRADVNKYFDKYNETHDSYLISHISDLTKSSFCPALFGIVQGGRHEDLRKESARVIGGMDFDGFGIGGSFDKEDISIAVGWVTDILPKNKPRHLLGIGEPEDLILGIENGIDTFDCVSPTRIARNGAAYVNKKSKIKDQNGKNTINLFNAEYKTDFTPIEIGCSCYTCTNYTKAYLAHLFRAKEMLAATLTSIHNLHFLIHLAKNARKAIVNGSWEEFKKSYIL